MNEPLRIGSAGSRHSGLDIDAQHTWEKANDGTTTEVNVVSPVFYDPKSERQNV